MAMGRSSRTKRRRQQDRLSKLDDGVLGRILSFLPAKEAARAGLLSSRWRDVFASVHTVSMEQPEGYASDDDVRRRRSPEAVRRPPFANGVSAALFGRHRRRAGGTPLRALRVTFDGYKRRDDSMVDGWISYAVQQSGPELRLDLRLGGGQICGRRCYVRSDELYIVPRGLFTCATLRSLSLGQCKLRPPAATSLPSLQTLFLSQVTDSSRIIQRLISGCPRLADLTLQACGEVTTLTVLDKRLRRLAIRCCRELATIAVDASELRVFEFAGAVPAHLTMNGPLSFTSCTVDLCGEEVSTRKGLTGLRRFLGLFTSTKHLHHKSARLGCGINRDAFSTFPAFSNLRHLEMTGCLPHDNDTAAIIGTVTRILPNAPSLEVLTLFFRPVPREPGEENKHRVYMEEELLDSHTLRYDSRCGDVLDVPAAMIPCMKNRVREINLVHYQGGDAQRTLAKFLLGSVARLDEMCCEFAEGPLYIQTRLMDEIVGWAKEKIDPHKIMFL